MYLRGGHAISRYKGQENAQEKVYTKAPRSYAERFYQEGARTLFIVDLEGKERQRLPEIKTAFPGEIWWAGQIRTRECILEMQSLGADRLVLGWSAQEIFESALAEFGPQLLIGGLQVQNDEEAIDRATHLKEWGFEDILIRDLKAEGTLFHPNFDLMEKATYFSGANIYASGGVSKMEHIELLQRAGVSGAVIGRALYENELSLKSVLELVRMKRI